MSSYLQPLFYFSRFHFIPCQLRQLGYEISMRMSAIGRKQTVDSAILDQCERPLLVKADIQKLFLRNLLWNVRYTPESCRWAGRLVNDCL